MDELINSPEAKLPSEKAPKSPKRKSDWLKKHRGIVLLALTILLIALSIFLWVDSIGVGARALQKHYDDSYISAKDDVYQEWYDRSFDRAEKRYHISNRAVISIGNLEEAEKLEVLKANDVEFIIQNRDRSFGNITAWLEVSGEGTFVVDLKAAEFIVDNARQYVLVRVPYPELTNITIIDAVERWFKDDWSDGSYSQGIDLAIKQRNEASLRIQKSLMSNQYIYDNAKSVAKSTITNLVRQFNSEVLELTVAVEFMD
jgi:hypothetical protein